MAILGAVIGLVDTIATYGNRPLWLSLATLICMPAAAVLGGSLRASQKEKSSNHAWQDILTRTSSLLLAAEMHCNKSKKLLSSVTGTHDRTRFFADAMDEHGFKISVKIRRIRVPQCAAKH